MKEHEAVEISESGRAVVESGLTVRQAHEITTGCSPDNLCERCWRDLGMNRPSDEDRAAITAAIQQALDDLLRAVLPAAEAAAALEGARAVLAHELESLIDAAISHAERLAVVVEGDLRAGAR